LSDPSVPLDERRVGNVVQTLDDHRHICFKRCSAMPSISASAVIC
jgi:hypothetical protein